MTTDVKQYIRSLVLASGATACGFADVEPVSAEASARYRQWIDEGHNASMGYLENYPDIRNNPALLLDGARTMIIALFPYYHNPGPQTVPHIADYALGADYHHVIREKLSPVVEEIKSMYGGDTRICVDTAPLRERYWANRAGLGYIGRNCQLIVPGQGSAFFIATILWTGHVAPDTPLPSDAGHICGDCHKCVDACPGHALIGNGELDASRCLSYLTIENRGCLPDGIRLDGNLYGCDVCRNVCPHSRPSLHVLPEFMPRTELTGLTLDDWLAMTGSQFKRLTANSAMRRTSLKLLKEVAARLKGM